MNEHFKDYRWKKGKPIGTGPLVELSDEENYKIVVDPYFKRYTVEKYQGKSFQTLVYDSMLLDFRKITPQEQTAWERETLQKEEGKEIAIIRDIHDRVIIREEYHFEEGLCRQCLIYSPHGLHVATQKMFYKKLGESFDGVRLYDLMGQTVMEKLYATDSDGNFDELLTECWEVNKN